MNNLKKQKNLFFKKINLDFLSRLRNTLLIFCFVSQLIGCQCFIAGSSEIDIVKSYYLLKYEYYSFLSPLFKAGAGETELIDFFEALEADLKLYDGLTEENLEEKFKQSLLIVGTSREFRNLFSIIAGCYQDELNEYITTDIVPEGLQELYQAVLKSFFSKNSSDKTQLIKLYEAYIKIETKNKYQESAILEFEASLNSVLAVLSDKDATQEDILNAVTALDNAYQLLEDKKLTGSPNSNNPSQGGGAAPSDKTEQSPSIPINNDNTVNNTKRYIDVDLNYWGYPAISYLTEKEILDGFPDGSFKPEAEVTREQFAKMVCTALGLEAMAGISDYDDCQPDMWCFPYVEAVLEAGIMYGTGDNRFGTGQNLIRQDLAVLTDRIIEKGYFKITKAFEDIPFADIYEASEYAREAINNTKKYGIINGIGDNLFAPKSTVTRAQAAQIIYNISTN